MASFEQQKKNLSANDYLVGGAAMPERNPPTIASDNAKTGSKGAGDVTSLSDASATLPKASDLDSTRREFGREIAAQREKDTVPGARDRLVRDANPEPSKNVGPEKREKR